ncbi:MAG: response regulator transcription factor [Bacilli bacterium]|nr:response regulator transcription factor [Bacilli bacterium]
MDQPKIRLVLADDQSIIRQGLRYILNAQPDMEVVGEAADGEQAVQVTLSTAPDVVLMDIQMPNCTGIEATRAILSTQSMTKVILLTTFDVQEFVLDGIRAGAVGYLLKDTDTGELLDAIRWAHQGQAIYRTTTAGKALAQAISSEAGDLSHQPPDLAEPLTERETAVLQQMAYGRRNSEIAALLYVSEGTIKTHVHRILQKLGVEDRTQAAVMAIRQRLVD